MDLGKRDLDTRGISVAKMIKERKRFVNKYIKHTAFAVVATGLVAAALALPNDVGRPDVEKVLEQKNVTQNAKSDIILHYRWDGEDTPHVYYENVNGSEEKSISYPGVPMKNTKDGWYTYTIQDAKSADIIFSIGDSYETATLTRTAGEWWFDQDTWYACNPDDETEQTTEYASTSSKKTTKQAEKADTLYPNKTVNDGEGTYNKKDVTTIAEDGSIKVGLSKITSAEEYVDTYVVAQDLSAADDASIIIHYYTGGSEVPSIYYWNGLPVDQETVWPGQPMTYEDENWYQYTFKDTDKINFLFTVGMNQTKDLTCKKGEWWYKDGKLYSKKPSDNGGSNNGGSETVDPSEKSDFREESIYFLMTTRFYDGDKSNNVHCWDENAKTDPNDPAWRGDFKGLIEKLDYIKALGFSAVWITPVVENASGLDYHGYHAMNFQKVDERYLSDDVSYQTLINEVHKRGMKIVQDVVFNHTGNFGETNLAPMFEKDSTVEGGLETVNCMKKCENSILPDNYYDSSKFKNSNEFGTWQYQTRLALMKDTKDPIHEGVRNDPKTFYHRYDNSFSWDFYTVQLGQMAGDCVDLNTENPIVSKYITDSYTKYINMGIDAFRIDTVKHISRLTFNNAILPALRAAGGKDFYMFGEVCTKSSQIWYRGETPALSGPFYTWKENKDYKWSYYDESVESAYDAYAATPPEKVYSDFSNELAYDNWRLESEADLPHGINMASTEQNYNDNANDVGGKNVKEGGTAQAAQPVSDNAFLNGNEYHQPDTEQASGLNVIDFTMHWNFATAKKAFESTTGNYDYKTNTVKNKKDTAGGDYTYNDSTWNVTYVDSHDYAPDGTQSGFTRRYNEGEEAWAENLCLLFTFRGIPCIYYGSEVEFQAGKVIDDGANVTLAETGRAYFGDYLEGDVTASDFGVYTAEAGSKVEETLAAPLSQQLIRLNTIRRKIPALQKGQYSLADIDYSDIAFKRRYTDSKTDSFVCVTITGNATFNNIPNGTYVDAVTGEKKEVINGTLSIDAPGKGNMRVYVLDTELSPAPGKLGKDTTYLK